MPDRPLLLSPDQPAYVAELADLLFSGLAERPMWNGFLVRVAQRMGGDAAAFVISAQSKAPEASAVLVPQGQSAAVYADLVEMAAFADLPFDRPLFFAVPNIQFDAQPRAHGGSGYAVLRLRLDGDRAIWLVCGASAGVESLAPDWEAVLDALLPLLQRVLRLYLVIGDSERRCRIAEHVLETSGVGVILVDSAGSVITVNAAAHAIMARSGVLGIYDGRLCAARQQDQQLLLRHIRDKAEQQSPDGADPACYATFALLRHDHPLPVTVMVRPGPSFGPVTAPLRRTATVILRDPGRRLRLAAPDLEKLFDLSPAEARLAQLLADGLSMEEAALQLGVSRNTVRSQLQAVFAKTGTNRQGDLVRLLLSSAATLAQRGGDAPDAD